MAISATFYKNDKKINSTSLPSTVPGTFGTTLELKDITNLFTPTLILNASLFHDANGDPVDPLEFNYVYLAEFDRYYWVRSWSWILGRWECTLEVDVLTSFRSQIGDCTTYVLRSASQYDNTIVDSKYPTKGVVKTRSSSRGSIWETNLNSTNVNSGFFVLGIVNNDTGAIGATSYYAVDGRGMRTFMSELYASPAWMNITDASISTDLQKMLINPIQYIVSCQWIPYALLNASSLTQVTTIPVGWWNITINSNDPFYKLTGSALKMTFYTYFDLVFHTQATGAFSWLKNSPYSQYQLRFYPFGVFPIDAAKLIGYDRIYTKVDLDLVTGIGTLTVTRAIGNTDYPSDILYVSDSQVGIPISMAQMSVDLTRAKDSTTWALAAGLGIASDTSAVSEIGGAAAKVASTLVPDVPDSSSKAMTMLALSGMGTPGSNWSMERAKWDAMGADTSLSGIASALAPKGGTGDAIVSLFKSAGKVAANIGNAVLASSGTLHTSGTNGALAQYTIDHTLTLFYFEIVDTNPVMYGYPLCKSVKISSLSGFVLCANEGNLSVNCSAFERQMIVSLMKEGFFYE